MNILSKISWYFFKRIYSKCEVGFYTCQECGYFDRCNDRWLASEQYCALLYRLNLKTEGVAQLMDRINLVFEDLAKEGKI